MATSARIDELRKKFDENPRRYFAPYANEFRKLGDLAQAIALCRTHLPNQPGHISGHIVLAQALYESRELAEARGVFEQALDLDPENLIALRYLGDIAREQGDAPTARAWYQRVLESDPRNDEIRDLIRATDQEAATALAQLAQLPTPTTNQVVAAEPDESAPEAWNSHPETDPLAWASSEPERAATVNLDVPQVDAAVHEDLGDLTAMPEPEHSDWFQTAEAVAEAVEVGSAADDFPEFTVDLEPASALAPDVAAEAAVTADTFVAEFASPSHDEPASSDDAATREFDVRSEVTEEVSASFVEQSAEPEVDLPEVVEASDAYAVAASDVEAMFVEDMSVPSDPMVESAADAFDVQIDSALDEVEASADEPALAPWELTLAEEPAVAASAPESVVEEWDPAVGRTPAFSSSVADEPPAPFVTETMAELYLQQGFNEEALAIYRQLLIQSPTDETLRQRVAALEEGARAPIITPLVSPAQDVARGPSIREFFRQIALRGTDDASSDGGSVASVERSTPSFGGVAHADEAMTQPDPGAIGGLADVFSGEPVAASDAQAADSLASAFRASSATPASELSLDSLFGQLPSASADAVTSAIRASGPEPSSPLASGPDGEATADVEQFTAWLEGLKKK